MSSRILSWLAKNKIHIIVWILFVVYELTVVGLAVQTWPNPIVDPVHYAVNISFFYFHANVTLPWVFRSKFRMIWLFVPALLLQLAIYIVIHFSCDKVMIALGIIDIKRIYLLNISFITRNLYRGIYFMGFSTGYYYLRTYILEKKKTAELEQEKLYGIIKQQKVEQDLTIAQHAYLKAQINPHFLFNTLDFVYHKVNAQSPVAGEVVIRLAEMMRHAIDSDEAGTVTDLGDEIVQVENLIYLNQVRKHEELNLQFNYDKNVLNLKLIPLVLLTLVENIFKHGDLSESNQKALIDIGVNSGYFYIETSNLINRTQSKLSNQSGLENIHKRLIYAYGSEVDFSYGPNEARYEVNLAIPVSLLSVQV